jgi:regulator of sirC expression with transglutaminase-like and TPR domain
MTDLPLADEFRAFARAPHDAVRGGLLVARIIDPATDTAWVLDELDRHAAAVPAPASAGALVEYLHGAGFSGAEAYYHVDNSSLARVLESRRGIPITLALVVLGIAERLGLAGRGINFPRHFLAEVDGRLVDPFAMRLLDADELARSLAAQGHTPGAALAPATPLDIVLRMLNNLRLIAQHRGETARALDLTGYQLLLSPEPLPLLIERVELWLAAGVPDMARHDLDRAIEIAPHAAVREQLAARRLELSEVPPRVH